MKVFHSSEAVKQPLRSARKHHPHYSPLARSRSTRVGVWLCGIRRQPRSSPDKLSIAVGGIEVATRKHFFEDGAEERREGDAAPVATVEEVRDDRVLVECAREQSTRLTALVSTQFSDGYSHGVIQPPNDLAVQRRRAAPSAASAG